LQTLEDYNLKELDLVCEEEAEHFQITKAFDLAKTLYLEKISPSNVQSKHIIICISGFLTEDVEKKESWRHAINHFKNAEVFALNWSSLSVSTIFNDGHYGLKKSIMKKYFRFLRTGHK
jgi:ribosomal protein S17E